MGKRLERFGEVRIIDETHGFGLDFVEKTASRFWSTTQDVEQYSKEGRIWDLYIDRIEGEKMRKTCGLLRGNQAFEMHV